MNEYQMIGAIGLILIAGMFAYLMWEVTREARRS
jgi:hypothetical protein